VLETPKIVLELTKTQTSKGYYKSSVVRPPFVTYFETFDDAWRALDRHWHSMHAWLAMVQNPVAADFVLSELLGQRSCLLNDFLNWNKSFDKLKAIKNRSLTQREQCVSTFLDCHIILARQILDVAIERGEMCWDRCVEDFEQVVELCCCVVAAENSFPSAKGFSSLSNGVFQGPTNLVGGIRKVAPVVVGQRYIPQEDTNSSAKNTGVLLFLDMGILPILFHVIRHCRDARIRLRTINFLEQYPRLEGLWNSFMVTRLARSLDAIERRSFSLEKAAVRGASAHEITSESRISRIDISFGNTREAHLILYRGDGNAATETIQIRETITW
jgi:hypothetical protein